MTLIFNIEYRTSWGEEVRVLGSIPELGNNQPDKDIHLVMNKKFGIFF